MSPSGVHPIDLTPHSLGSNSDVNSVEEKLTLEPVASNRSQTENLKYPENDYESGSLQQEQDHTEKAQVDARKMYIENLSETPEKSPETDNKIRLNISTAKIFTDLGNSSEPKTEELEILQNTNTANSGTFAIDEMIGHYEFNRVKSKYSNLKPVSEKGSKSNRKK